MSIYDLIYYPVETGLFIIAFILCTVFSIKVKTTFAKYNVGFVRSGMKAHEVARMILDNAGLYDVTIMQTMGRLTDHYDPRTKTLALSETVFNNATVAAIGVAAHECGHAIQHAKGYTPLMIRQTLAPVASFFSRSWVIILAIGFAAGLLPVVQIGIGFFAFIVVFQFITLPVEFNASQRAIDIIIKERYLYGEEVQGARKVLRAAAMTYITSFLLSLTQLIKLLAKAKRR